MRSNCKKMGYGWRTKRKDEEGLGWEEWGFLSQDWKITCRPVVSMLFWSCVRSINNFEYTPHTHSFSATLLNICYRPLPITIAQVNFPRSYAEGILYLLATFLYLYIPLYVCLHTHICKIYKYKKCKLYTYKHFKDLFCIIDTIVWFLQLTELKPRANFISCPINNPCLFLTPFT